MPSVSNIAALVAGAAASKGTEDQLLVLTED